MAAVELVMDGNPSGGGGPKASGGVSISRRAKKAVIDSDSEEDQILGVGNNGGGESSSSCLLLEGVPRSVGGVAINYSMDISQLEAPTFTTLERGPCLSMTSLKWDHGVNLIGKKVVNPMIHCCDKCLKPILIYGRMIPCKHVFCLKCAQSEKNGCCSRCGDKVSHVDHAGLGSIYMCSHGGSRYGNNGCRRTYLSQRDLQAHIRHRHLKSSVQQQQQHPASSKDVSAVPSSPANASLAHPSVGSGPSPIAAPPRLGHPPPPAPLPLLKAPPPVPASHGPDYARGGTYSPRTIPPPPPSQQGQQSQQQALHAPPLLPTQPISVISSNRTASNLITVPIEGGEPPPPPSNGGGDVYSSYYNGGGPYAPPPYPNYSHPPPNYPPPPGSAGDPNNYYATGYESAYNSGSYRTPNPGGAPTPGGATSYYGARR